MDCIAVTAADTRSMILAFQEAGYFLRLVGESTLVDVRATLWSVTLFGE